MFNQKKLKQYIIDLIADCDDADFNTKTKREKVEFMKTRFESEMRYNIKADGRFKAMIYWFQGLCNTVPLEYENYKIIELGKEWGTIPKNASESKEDLWLENYWGFMAMRALSLIDDLEKKNPNIFKMEI